MAAPPSAVAALAGAASERQLYDSDPWSWAQQQAAALRRRDLAAVDWENVAEEIESVGRAERSRWTSACARALEHLLAIEHWRAADGGLLRHWEKEIRTFRAAMARAIEENPGLQGRYDEILERAWRHARDAAVERLADYECERDADGRTQRAAQRKWERRLPERCPYALEHVAAFDPRADRKPRADVFPPAVAKVLNERAGFDCPILPEPRPDRGRGWDWSR